MNEVSRTPETVTGLVNSLESHEGTMTERERHLCTTLLHGLAAAGQLRLAPAVPATGLHPDYNYESATEGERWHYDMGFEAGHQDALTPTSIPEVREVIQDLVSALDKMAAEGES